MSDPYQSPREVDTDWSAKSPSVMNELHAARFGCYSVFIAIVGLLYIAWKSLDWLASTSQQ